MDDWELICAYRNKAEDAESAFAELVRRHVHVVYSAAHRSLGQNAGLADDVVQRTFALFARKIPSFTPGMSVVGWLYKATCNISREVARSESRRHTREIEAGSMQRHFVDPETNSNWEEIAPLLEQAMCALPENDRVTVLLRFFERKPFGEIAENLGVSEDAAKMRVSRALQKLRSFFTARGISVSTTALGAMLWDSSVSAAPPALLSSLTAAQLASATVPLSIATKWVLMTNFQKSAIVAISLLLVSLTGYQIQRKFSNRTVLRTEPIRAFDGALVQKGAPTSAAGGTFNSLTNDARMERALANLRQAISEEWPNRRLPKARLEQALEDLGPNRRAAIPVLLEFLKATPPARSLTTMVGAGYCLELLGTEASEALPELVNLAARGDLALLNDGVPNLFTAVSPDGGVLPGLIGILSDPPRMGAQQFQITINRLIEMNPHLADTYRPQIASGLQNPDPVARLNAATTLARLPGPKDPAAIPILVDALAMERLRDPKAYEPIDIGNNTTMNRAGLQFEDEIARVQAIKALGEMGPAAKEVLPIVREFAELRGTNSAYSLRDYAMAAIGKIDPEARSSSAELDMALRSQEREAELRQKAQSGTATFAELEEGLRSQQTADFAAHALAGHPEARSAIPALVEAIDQFGAGVAVERIKELDPHLLIERVKARNTNGLNEVAYALGELGPAAAEAVPYLRRLLDETRANEPDLPRPHALDEAIHKIDPTQPKLLYKFDDLHEATSALVQAIHSQGKTTSQIYDTYILDFQDINAVSRGQVLRLVETTKADPALHSIFVKKLIEKNPELAGDLRPR